MHFRGSASEAPRKHAKRESEAARFRGTSAEVHRKRLALHITLCRNGCTEVEPRGLAIAIAADPVSRGFPSANFVPIKYWMRAFSWNLEIASVRVAESNAQHTARLRPDSQITHLTTYLEPTAQSCHHAITIPAAARQWYSTAPLLSPAVPLRSAL